MESRYPSHWGEPPARQTRDYRQLPKNYGMGSGTLKKWILEKMAADEAAATATAPTITTITTTITTTTESTNSTSTITVKLLYFASVREAVSKSEEELQIPKGTTCQQLLTLLSQTYPGLLPLLSDLATAVNEKYEKSETVLQHRDTVAVMPPISGG